MPTPEEMRAIARLPRRPQSPEHRQAISEGIRKAGKRRHYWTDALTPQEREDYRTLTSSSAGLTRAEALRSIGREDLIT
jgi:hypothetical protein